MKRPSIRRNRKEVWIKMRLTDEMIKIYKFKGYEVKPVKQVDIMKTKKILHLTLKKKWFKLIANGEKTIEYREMKPYWDKRFFEKDSKFIKRYDEIYFRNGYKKDSPFMRVEWKGLFLSRFNGEKVLKNNCYCIILGKVLGFKKAP